MIIRISAKVIPSARKSEIKDVGSDILGRRNLKIKVNQPPEDKLANNAVLEMIADYFNTKKNNVEITSGQTSRNKIIEVRL